MNVLKFWTAAITVLILSWTMSTANAQENIVIENKKEVIKVMMILMVIGTISGMICYVI